MNANGIEGPDQVPGDSNERSGRHEANPSPLRLLAKALRMRLTGRARRIRPAPEDRIEEEGETFQAFRKVVVRPRPGQAAKPGAIFRVRFRFKTLSQGANRILSLIPIPLIVAQPGFRSKTWYLGTTTGEFIGLYEFETVADAEAYWDSLPLRMMRRRAAEGSLTHSITPLPT